MMKKEQQNIAICSHHKCHEFADGKKAVNKPRRRGEREKKITECHTSPIDFNSLNRKLAIVL
jgi:hypothetical protein